MLELPGWAALKIPAKGGLWNKWAAVKGEKIKRPDGLRTSTDVHRWARDHVRYKREPIAADEWLRPSETIKRGVGDCEDFAVLERALLLSVGYKDAEIAILVAHDLAAKEDHAVCFVGEFYLDCRADRVLHRSLFTDYRPIFAFQSNAAWTFGRVR